MSMWISRAASFVAATMSIVAAASANPSAPDGWTINHNGTAIVLNPPNLPSGQEFDAVISAAVPLGERSLKVWLQTVMASDQPKLGTVVNDGGIHDESGGLISCVRGFHARSGRAFVMVYVAIPQARGARLVRIATTSVTAWAKADIATAIRYAMSLSGSNAPGSDDAASPRQSPSGGGIESSRIAGVLNESYSGTGVGGMATTEYTPVILLKDGWYCDNIAAAPIDINEAEGRRKDPHSWGRWRRSGDGYQTLNASTGRWEDASWDNPMAPAAVGDRIAGTYESLGGGVSASGGGTSLFIGGTITFYENGTCRMEHDVSASSDGAVLGSRQSGLARYWLDGYTITIAAGGKTSRRAFFWMDPVKKDGFYINNVAYVKQRQ